MRCCCLKPAACCCWSRCCRPFDRRPYPPLYAGYHPPALACRSPSSSWALMAAAFYVPTQLVRETRCPITGSVPIILIPLVLGIHFQYYSATCAIVKVDPLGCASLLLVLVQLLAGVEYQSNPALAEIVDRAGADGGQGRVVNRFSTFQITRRPEWLSGHARCSLIPRHAAAAEYDALARHLSRRLCQAPACSVPIWCLVSLMVGGRRRK